MLPTGRRISDRWLLGLLLLVLVLHNALWLHRDMLNPLWDEAQYLLKSLETFAELKQPSLASLKELYFQRVGVRPTFFFTVLAAPFYLLFGTSGDVAILAVNSIAYAVVLWTTYALGRHLFDRRVGLLAAFVAALAHHVSVLSRIFWPHFSVLAVVGLGTLLLFRSQLLTRRGPTLLYGVVLGLGMMVRPVYPALFLFAPTLLICLRALLPGDPADPWRRLRLEVDLPGLWQRFRTRIVLGLVLALLIAAAIAGPFYARTMSRTLSFVSAVDADYSENYSERSNYLWYLENLHLDTSLFMILAVAAGIAAGLLRRRPGFFPVFFCACTSFLLLSIPSFKYFPYFAPMYPLLAILSVFWIFDLRADGIRRAAVAVTVLASLAGFVVTAWGAPQSLEPLTSRIFAYNSHPPDRNDWRWNDIAGLIAKAEVPSSTPRVGFVSESKLLAPATFRYQTRPLGERFAYSAAGRTLETFLKSDYVVVKVGRGQIPRGKPGRRLNVELLRNRDSVFYRAYRRVAVLPVDGQRPIKVFHRRRPLSTREAKALARELIAIDPVRGIRQIEQETARRRLWPRPILGALESAVREARADELADS